MNSHQLKSTPSDIFRDLEQALVPLIGRDATTIITCLIVIAMIGLVLYGMHQRAVRHENANKYEALETSAEKEGATPEELVAQLKDRLAETEARAAAAEEELLRLHENEEHKTSPR